jgi:phycobilisome core-membrane linker protein
MVLAAVGLLLTCACCGTCVRRHDRDLSPHAAGAGSIGAAARKPVEDETPRFIELGAVTLDRSAPEIANRIAQGVTKKREQTKVFKLTTLEDKPALKVIINATYRQIFERDIAPYIVKNEFTVLETQLSNGDITLKEFIEGLGTSRLYIREFYTPYPNTKVIELGTKHFLGRAPLDQAEIRKYNQILATSGLKGFIGAMVNNAEYAQAFGEDTVPYNRFLTLPAANYPNTQKLYNTLTKQNKTLVVPSFEPAKSNGDAAKLPLTSQAVAAQASANGSLAGVGRSSGSETGTEEASLVRRKAARIYRLTPGMSDTDMEQVITAIYTQVLDVFSEPVPDQFRRADLEDRLRSGNLTIRDFVGGLASSDIYSQRFYTVYPNAKVIELLFRHLLGRAPETQVEIRQYNQLLAEKGLKAAVDVMVNSVEYDRYFGEDVVPYRRFPTVPTGNYLGSVKAETNLS